MILKRLVVGMFSTNCYLVGCPETKQGVVIDPGFEGEIIIAEINRLGLAINYIINTHAHVDHISANAPLKEATGGLICLPQKDVSLYENPSLGMPIQAVKQPDPDRLLVAGEKISFGTLVLEVLETPGHTEGGISLLGPGMVFTGDTLFAGSIGRTDFPGGSMERILQSIHSKLMVLPETTLVYPGHGPETDIGREKRANPFLRN